MLKYVVVYSNMPHSSAEEKPSRLMFSRDVRTKLLQHVKVPEDQHHKDARKCETVAKVKMKRYFDKTPCYFMDVLATEIDHASYLSF